MTYGQRISATAAGIEAVTGLFLLVAPSLLAKLLIGSSIDGPAIVVANIAGLALISLAIACWPRLERVDRGGCVALLVYNLTATLLLAQAGSSGTASGFLLWPAVLIHLLLTILLALTLGGLFRGTKQSS